MPRNISTLLIGLMMIVFILTGCARVKTASVSGTQPSQPTAPYSYVVETLDVSRNGQQIYAQVYVPQNAGSPLPAVIFSHGFGGTHRVGIPYAQALAQAGYIVCCFDFCGGSPNSQSDGSTLNMSIFTEQSDLEAIMAALTQRSDVDSTNLFLMGTSQGGAVSAITAAAHPEAVRGLILLYPAFNLVAEANARYPRPEAIPDASYFLWMDVGSVYFESLLNYDIYNAAAGYTKDVLILHGDADSIVPLSSSQQALAAYPSAELKVIPDAGHGFYDTSFKLACDYTLDYLNAHRTH